MKLITILVIGALSVAAQTPDGAASASAVSEAPVVNAVQVLPSDPAPATPADVSPSVAPAAVQSAAAPAPAAAKPTLRHRIATVINDILIGGVVVLVWIASGASH